MNEQAEKVPSVDHGNWFTNAMQIFADEGRLDVFVELSRKLKAEMEAEYARKDEPK